MSDPLRNSFKSFPLWASHIRTSVPLNEVVATNRPEEVTESVVRGDSCAAIIETGCLAKDGGGLDGGIGGGGPSDSGGLHGGSCTSCMCPICRPGITSSVAYGAVAMARTPSKYGMNGCQATMIQDGESEERPTSWIITSVVLSPPDHGLVDFKDNDSSTQCNTEPATSTSKTANLFPELKLSDLGPCRIVPEDHLVGWIQRTTPATKEEEQRRRVAGHNCCQSSPTEF